MDSDLDAETRIFDAAIEVFGEAGRRGARIEDIARRAKINSALVHYYYRTKDRLYEDVFAYIFRTTFKLMERALCDAPDFRTVLKTFIEKFIDLIEDNPAVFRFMMREIGSGAPVLQQTAKRLIENKKNFPPRVFVEKCRQAMQRGEIREVDPIQILVTVLGACVYHQFAMPLLNLIQPGIASRRTEFIEQRKKAVFDILYLGLKSPTADA